MAPPLMSISDMGVNLGDRWLLRGVIYLYRLAIALRWWAVTVRVNPP